MITLEKSQHSLQLKLQKPELTPAEVTEGIRECFMNCQMVFMQQRRPQISTAEVGRIADELVREVYDEEGISVETATPTMLRHVIGILDQRFEFMQDPEIRQVHMGVLELLLGKLDNNTTASTD